MILWLTTFGASIASALLPFLPIEVYVVGVAATDPPAPAALGLGVAAGLGATVGKIIWYEAARRGVESSWAHKKLYKPKVKQGYERWLGRMR